MILIGYRINKNIKMYFYYNYYRHNWRSTLALLSKFISFLSLSKNSKKINTKFVDILMYH